jgi:hypothetical protein
VKPAWQPRARPSLTFPTEKPTWPVFTPARPAKVGAKQQKPVYKVELLLLLLLLWRSFVDVDVLCFFFFRVFV